MSAPVLDELESQYDCIQSQLVVASGSPALADAVHFGTNRGRPVHRWFHFKEGFSADLFPAAGIDTRSLESADSVFLDPFCGCGTTLLSGDLEFQWRSRRIGFEVNPFLAFVAQTKVAWRDYCPEALDLYASEIFCEPLAEDFSTVQCPSLSTFKRVEMILPERLSALLDAVQRIRAIDAPERDLLLLGVATAVERLGFYRKDGRALRILRSSTELAERQRVNTHDTLRGIWSTFATDLRTIKHRKADQCVSRGRIINDDGRHARIPQELDTLREGIDLIVYSPPYLNHIDYTEVYKMELWLLGFVATQSEMLAIRKQTLRSHASIRVAQESPDLPPLVRHAIELATTAVTSSESKWHRHFGNLTLAYLADMRSSLIRQFELLRPGALAVCVIANSAHGAKRLRVPIAVDLFIASLAAAIGFEVKEFLIARQLRRRDHLNRFLRETVIVLRKPVS